MFAQKLSRSFFNRPTLRVARDLLGKFLVRKIGRKVIIAMITETEAYCGPNDLASHASRGRTARTEVMFGPPGHAYVYLIYGMYHCLNVVTEREGCPAAVLIRSCELKQQPNSKFPAYRIGRQLTNSRQFPNSKFQFRNLKPITYNLKPNSSGPGKLCRHLQVDRSLNKEDLIISRRLWFEDRGVQIKPGQIKRVPRVGVDYAGKYKNKLWRLVLKLV